MEQDGENVDDRTRAHEEAVRLFLEKHNLKVKQRLAEIPANDVVARILAHKYDQEEIEEARLLGL